MEKLLISRLEPVVRRHRRLALSWQLAACWSLTAIVGFGLILFCRQTGWASPFTLPALAGLAGAAATALILSHHSTSSDYRAIAQKIEQRHPELNGLLLTAVQQQAPAGGKTSYLQHRLLEEAIEHSRTRDWREVIPRSRLRVAQAAQLAALGLLFVALVDLRKIVREGGGTAAAARGIVVTPGDTSIERGESLVVLARFGGALPPGVTLVVRTSGAVPRQIALVKSLADPVFGASIPDVDHDLTYHLEYAGRSTRDFKVSVFEHPRLDQADAVLTFPAYTRLATKRIENTRRVSAVEGTRLELALRLNKPVASAALVARDAKKTVIPLQVALGKAVASLPEFPLVASQTYDLRLVDLEGRVNAVATPFVIDVLPDRPPEVHVTAPRGDQRPSPIEEISFGGTLLGDFGVTTYGLAYTLAGGDTKVIELGRSVPAMEKRPFNYTLSLEALGVQPDQLMSWYIWADDIGPDGKPRRTTGDLFFAEIRPFEEIFRESNGMPSSDDPAGGAQGQGNENQRLTELQKKVINATWKLQRDPAEPKYVDDAKIVHDGQDQALTQAGTAQERAEDPRAEALWTAVTQQLKEALEHLQQAGKTPTALAPALASEQAAYQSLLKLQSRDAQVSRGRRGGGGGGGGQSQRQLDQLDLTQEKNRYETQRQATPAESPERREQLQVMNRLQELAHRQQDVNDRLKEMQTALQEARTDQERENIRQQLKRLQDEQQQVLADVDELRQRIDQQQDQSNMSEQRQQLEQTRNDVQSAAEAAGKGAVAEALASGTRAQRQFQDMREQLHKQNSSQFSDDLRDMRAQARELADQEESVAQKLDPLANGAPQKRLSDAATDDGAAHILGEQKKRMSDLVDRAKQVSQQAENSEPLLAEKLYDSLRKLGQDDTGTAKEFQQQLLNSGLLTRNLNDQLTDQTAKEGTKALDLTSALLQQGYLPQAGAAEERARAEIDEFRNGIEQAAESVVGDDTAALKLAQSELDSVTDQLKQEAGQAPAPGGPGGQTPKANPSAADREQMAKAAAQLSDSVRQRPDDAQAHNDLGEALQALGREAEAEAQFKEAAQLSQAQGQGQPNAAPGSSSDSVKAAMERRRLAQQAAAQSGGRQGQNGPATPAGQNGQASAGSPAGQLARDSSGSGAAGAAAGEPPGGPQGQNGPAGGTGQNGQAPAGSPAGRLAGGAGGRGAGGAAADPLGLDNLLNGGANRTGGARGAAGAPITGNGYGQWSDRLRDVEEIVDAPDLRNAVAAARERARLLRQDYTRDLKRPDWAVVQLEIVKPLLEVRNQIADELARRGSKDSLVPIDRDPVPNRYAESVRKYYEELGTDK